MTPLPTDPIDPAEARLAGLVRQHSDRAVTPIDAVAIAHGAAAAGRPRHGIGRLGGATTAFGRLGWILVGALLAVAAIGGVALSGGGKGPSVPVAVASAVPTAPPTTAPSTAVTVPTPAPTAQVALACTAAEISVRVIDWTGAAGSRIASLKVTNAGGAPCLFPTITRPQLVDGRESILINGTTPTSASTVTLGVGASLTTMAADSNYCGPTPVAPVTVAIVLADGSRVVAAPVSPTDTFGLAPCMGSGSPADITIRPWRA